MNDAPAPSQEKGRQAGLFLGTLAACIVLAIVIIVLGVRVQHLNAQLPESQTQLSNARAELAQAQTDLAKARADNANLAGLKVQLDATKAQSAELQVQVDKAKAQVADLQAQADKAKAEKAESAKLQAQLDEAKAKAAELQGKLSGAAAESSQVASQLDQAKNQISDLQARLQKAESDLGRLQPLIQMARHMPVTTSFDSGSWGSSFKGQNGYTLRINNLGQQALKVDVTITGAGKPRLQSSVMEVGATLKVEKLVAGESVVVASEGYDPLSLTVK
jgi:chromosome segregation ATPase